MSWARDNFIAFDHVRMVIAVDGEQQARAFYVGVLGMTELKQDAVVPGRGGVLLSGGDGGAVQIHLVAAQDFRPALSAYPAVLVRDLDALADRLAAAGIEVRWDGDADADGARQIRCDDPFGNHLAFVEGFGE